jgi:hypothetical protein
MARQSSLSPMRAGAHFFLAEPLSEFPLWHLADIRICSADVRFRGQSGHQREAIRCLLLTQSGHASATARIVCGLVLVCGGKANTTSDVPNVAY